MAQKTALLIGVTTYGEGIPPLSAAANDVAAMEAVLKNPDMGGFDTVTALVNPDFPEMQEAIFQLFQQATKEDLVLLFFSGHGITDDNNHLYLSTRRTAKHNFAATAVPARFVQDRSHLCYAKRQVMILDCCYSGAFKEGWHLKSVGLDLKRELGLDEQGAEGRAVLTSSSATQTSFQQDGAALSLYTQYLVEGMETGIADTDEDGRIYIHELHDYAKAKVQEVKPKQKPDIILDREGFKILISRSPLQDPKLRFRREVETYAAQTEDHLKQWGDFSAVGKITLLQVKRQEAGLTEIEAEAIVASVREPYRRQLANRSLYRQALVAAFEMGDPFPVSVQRELQVLRDALGLGDAEVQEIAQHPEVRQAQAHTQDRAIEQQRQREAAQAAETQRQEAERQQNLQRQRELAEQQAREQQRQQQAEIARQAERKRQEKERSRREKAEEKPTPPVAKKQEPSATPKPTIKIGRRTFTLLGLSGLATILTPMLRSAFTSKVESPPIPSPTLEVSPTPEPQPLSTKPFTFTTATVDAQGKVTTREGQKEEYVEDLGNGIGLRMVKIVGGKFLMGQTEAEKTQLLKEYAEKDYQKSFSSESPQYEVTVPDFFMGMFTVTQAQWKAVVQLPKIKTDLKPDSSRFTGKLFPVEQISWDEAIEFCDRLSAKTGKSYTLPSEAQWEYACRAGTQTAFAFGDILTPELANYNWTTSYNGSPRSSYPQETQPVGIYPANAWGLYEMHGNVWEWCQDDWHENYNGAPENGSAWTDKNISTAAKILRGGSWVDYPWYCRSAARAGFTLDGRFVSFGFRVCCLAPRVLP